MPAWVSGSEDDRDRAMRMARQYIARGDALGAVDSLSRLDEGLHSRESRQLQAHALLRSGSPSHARRVLAELLAEGADDEETLGLAAREAKARWQLGESAALQEAQRGYLHAFRLTHGSWTGINAATLSLAAGDAAQARTLAREVHALAQAQVASGQADFWTRAVVAESLLVQGEVDAAMAAYRAAVAAAPRAFGHHRATLDNARMVLAGLGLAPDVLQGVFPRATIAAFCGHMLDAPGRSVPRFPASDEPKVAQWLADAVEEHRVDVGIAAAACGTDILFLEAVRARGGEIQVVLPCPPEDFRRVSVTEPGGAQWGKRFDDVLDHAEQVTVLASHLGEDLSYQFHGAVLAGLARLRAHAVEGNAIGLAYWDGQAGGVGGTASVLAEWGQHGFPLKLLGKGAAGVAPEPTGDSRRAGGQRVVAVLFADAVGYSRLGDAQVKLFMHEFWGRVAGLLRDLPDGALLSANTWGDGLFLVLGDTVQAAGIALAIARMVDTTDWAAAGLPAQTQVRIALHSGPAYEMQDPVTGRPTFAGMHVSRAARIEPVTPPGSVYVSEPFAALLAFDDNGARFRCEYVGTVPLAKDYGRLRTYRLISN